MAGRIAQKLLHKLDEAEPRKSVLRGAVAAGLSGGSVALLVHWMAGLQGTVALTAAAMFWAVARSLKLARQVESVSRQLAQSTGSAEPNTGQDGQIATFSMSMPRSIRTIAAQEDPLFRQLAYLQLADIDRQVTDMAEGRIVFVDTESWRTAYERILAAPGLGYYLSAAWLRSEDYWRDAPGRHSIRLNYDLVQLGLRIERTLILNDFFWPEGAALPAKTICRWIEDQYKHGLVIRLVRESELADETTLLADFGIYGDRATGTLELDDRCRSLRYTLDFARSNIQAAEDRWRRLQLFSYPFRELLDRALRGG